MSGKDFMQLRGNTWWFRKVVPADLREAIGQTEIKQLLGKDKATATLKKHELAAHWTKKFAELRNREASKQTFNELVARLFSVVGMEGAKIELDWLLNKEAEIAAFIEEWNVALNTGLYDTPHGILAYPQAGLMLVRGIVERKSHMKDRTTAFFANIDYLLNLNRLKERILDKRRTYALLILYS